MPQATVSRMRHRADIERDSAAVGSDGNPSAPSWAVSSANAKCFAWSTSWKEPGENEAVVLEIIRAIMPLGTNVAERDRLAAVKDRAGATIIAGPLLVEAIQRHATHLELSLKRVNP